MTQIIECRGVKIPHDPRFISEKVAKRLRKDMYETPEVTGLAKFIKPSDRVLELGAGIGFISSYVATNLGVTEITCIEANPELCSYIRTVHATNGVASAEVLNTIALPDDCDWPESDAMPFYITDPFWSSSMIKPRDANGVTETQVPVMRLSALIDRIRPSVIICDIEGGEETLFNAVDLTGVRAIFLELHTRVYGGHGVRRVFDAMHRHDFFYHQKASCADVVMFERLKPLV